MDEFKVRFVGFLLVFTLSIGDALSQERIASYSLEEGLPSRQIYDIAKDTDGFLWLGTAGGLSRFDGYDFITFDSSNVDGLKSHQILTLLHSQDELWLGTHNGIYVFDLRTYRIDWFLSIPGDVRQMIADRSGKVYFSDEKGDVRMIADRQVTTIQNHLNYEWTNSTVNIVTTFGETDHGVWWGRLDGSVAVHDRSTGSVESIFDGRAHKRRGSPILVSDTTSILFATEGLWKTELGESETLISDDINGRGVLSKWINKDVMLHIDGQGNTFEVSLNTNTIKENPYLKDLLSTKSGVNNLFVDNDIWWFVTNDGLLQIRVKSEFFQKTLNDKSASVRSILEYDEGNFLVSTYQGLYYLDAERELKNWDNYPYLVFDAYWRDHSQIWSLDEDRGLMTGNGSMTEFENFSLADDHLRYQCAAVFEDRVFVGTLSGLYEFDIEKKSLSLLVDSLSDVENIDNVIFDLEIIEDQLFIGSDKGLSIFNINTDRLEHMDELKPYVIRDIYEGNGLLWLGTQNSGIASYDPVNRQLVWYNRNNGLANNTVNSIISSYEKQFIWIGTNNGLSRLNTVSETITNYYEEDGISHNEFNRKAAIQDSKGNIWMGGLDGITIFNPNEFIGDRRDSAQLILTGTGKFDGAKEQVVFEADEIIRNTNFTYRPNDRLFRFRFALSDMENPGQNQFRYRIEGLHDEWVGLSTQRELLIDNLNPGDYSLLIAGTNGKGMWSAPLELTLSVDYAYYQKWWFYGSICLVLIFVGVFIHNVRVRQILRIERVRTKIARDLHDELGSTLTRISMASEIALDSSDKKEEIQNVAQMSRDASSTLSDIVWSIDNTDDSVESLVDRIKDHLYQMAQVSSLESRFELNEIKGQQKLDADVKQNLFLIAKEAINNSVKYSNGNLLTVQFGMANDQIKLMVEDNGIVENADFYQMKTRGNGLKNMEARAISIGGNFEIRTIEAFTISIEAPLPSKR